MDVALSHKIIMHFYSYVVLQTLTPREVEGRSQHDGSRTGLAEGTIAGTSVRSCWCNLLNVLHAEIRLRIIVHKSPSFVLTIVLCKIMADPKRCLCALALLAKHAYLTHRVHLSSKVLVFGCFLTQD